MSCNPNLEQGVVEVAHLLENNCMKKLDLSNCMLSTETICDLSSALKEKNIQVETLNMSENDPTFIVTRHHAEAVCELLKNVSKELIFELQSMQPQVRKTLQHGLEELANEKEIMVILWNGDILRPEKSQAQPTTTSLE
uniref:uncharacterized protein LOC120331845 n=1 Tax=Styela clava TaxID=7725 RepID=UPI00193A19C6|nr:uncharacterized protein LOC120331845 [Styela clava]